MKRLVGSVLGKNTKTIVFISCLLSVVLIIYVFRSLDVTYLFPIYPDEIAERIFLSRIGFDFPIKFDLAPMCKKQNYHYPIVWFFPGLIEWLWHSQTDNLKTFRIIGIITSYLFSASLVFKLSQKNIGLFEPFYKKIIFLTLALGSVLSLLNLGVVPFFLVTVRPEQTILLLLSCLLILLDFQPKKNSHKILLVLIYFIMMSLMLYQHPKTFFLLPVLFLIAYNLFSHYNRLVISALFLLLIGMVIANYSAWTQTYDCSDSQSLNDFLSSFNLDFKNIIKNPHLFFSLMWHSLLNGHTEITRINFQSIYEVNYLPNIQMTLTLSILKKFISLTYLSIFGALLLSSVNFYRSDLLKKKIITHSFLTIILLLCCFSNLIINLCKHWYDAGYLWCLLVISAIFFISKYIPRLSMCKLTYQVICYLLMLCIISVHCFITNFRPPLTNGYQGPGVSIMNYNYENVTKELNEASLKCHLDQKKSQNLILDDETYLYFQQSKYPLTYTYLFLGPYNPDFLRTFTNKFDIDGLIIRDISNYLPELMQRKYGIKIGKFVCVEKENIKPLFAEMFGRSD